jgi:hypothetical protein
MTVIVTALFEAEKAVTNVVEDLVATGIPRDRIALDTDRKRVSVTTGEQAEPEIEEILSRHRPTEVDTRSIG